MTSNDPDERMPPPKTGKKPTPEQMELIRRWIAEGAKWSDHWSYVPPKLPAVPVSQRRRWSRNEIDRFVRARLAQEKLTPAAEADKIALLRRLSLDVIGLPPTIAEVDAFLADNSPGAYVRQVDRLLASPHYGERWGRIWLDAARYADSDGYEKDKSRQVWFYRDWVTGALNRDLPYDQFIIDQIAGDELPHPTQDQIVATGFLRNSMLNEEGGVDPEQFRMEAMFDRMDAIGKSVLGLTIQCAQCHNHKYDPLTQEEYYRLFAFLNNDYEANIAVYTPDEQRQRADIFRHIHEIESGLRHRHPDWPERMARWEEQRPQRSARVDRRPAGSRGSRSRRTEALSSCRRLDPRAGICPDEGRQRNSGEDHGAKHHRFSPRAAQRSEFAARRAGPIDQGDVCPDRIRRDEPLRSMRRRKRVPVEIVRATADVNPPETPLEAIFDDKTGRRRVTGPI